MYFSASFFLQTFVFNSVSFFDVSGNQAERVYYAFVLGLLVNLDKTHQIKSNRESGLGRYDVMIVPRKQTVVKTGVLIEFKRVYQELNETLETACESALKQIDDKKYETELQDLGLGTIFKYGIAKEPHGFV